MRNYKGFNHPSFTKDEELDVYLEFNIDFVATSEIFYLKVLPFVFIS